MTIEGGSTIVFEKIDYMLKLGHLTLGGGRSQGKCAAGQEVNPGWRSFCRAQEEWGGGRGMKEDIEILLGSF